MGDQERIKVSWSKDERILINVWILALFTLLCVFSLTCCNE